MKSLRRALRRGRFKVLFNPLTMNLEMYRLTTRGRWQRTYYGRDIMSASQYTTNELNNIDKEYVRIAEQIEEQLKEAQNGSTE